MGFWGNYINLKNKLVVTLHTTFANQSIKTNSGKFELRFNEFPVRTLTANYIFPGMH